jgi:CDP-diacylglycerol--glycerol-3-phosphate 3-phosphatidyltransferase
VRRGISFARVSPSDPPPSTSGSPRSVRPPRRARVPRRTLAEDAVNLPNLLTMARVFMIPACLWFLDQGTQKDCFWAAIVFTVAALTDAIDGWLARRMGVVSVLGKFLDPLADKLIVMASLVWMVPMGRIPGWVVIVLLAREISVTGLRSVAASEGVVIAAGSDGKTKTALQMVGIIALLLGYPYHLHYLGIDCGILDTIVVGRMLVYGSLFFSLLSALEYVRLFALAVEAKETKRKEKDAARGGQRA